MIIYKDIIQQTEEWHRIKWGKIGGSTSKGLFVPSDTLLVDLLSCYLEPFEMEEDHFVNYDMQRGIELQPLAIERLSEYCGVKFEDAGWIQNKLIDLIGISPDGINHDATISCEVKCLSKEKHSKILYEQAIPSDNTHQCLHYFTVNPKLEEHYFASFRPESTHPLWVKKLTLDSLIDLGTKANPKVNKVFEWVKIARGKAMEIDGLLKVAIAKLESI